MSVRRKLKVSGEALRNSAPAKTDIKSQQPPPQSWIPTANVISSRTILGSPKESYFLNLRVSFHKQQVLINTDGGSSNRDLFSSSLRGLLSLWLSTRSNSQRLPFRGTSMLCYDLWRRIFFWSIHLRILRRPDQKPKRFPGPVTTPVKPTIQPKTDFERFQAEMASRWKLVMYIICCVFDPMEIRKRLKRLQGRRRASYRRVNLNKRHASTTPFRLDVMVECFHTSVSIPVSSNFVGRQPLSKINDTNISNLSTMFQWSFEEFPHPTLNLIPPLASTEDFSLDVLLNNHFLYPIDPGVLKSEQQLETRFHTGTPPANSQIQTITGPDMPWPEFPNVWPSCAEQDNRALLQPSSVREDKPEPSTYCWDRQRSGNVAESCR